jgi:hypothetical protein
MVASLPDLALARLYRGRAAHAVSLDDAALGAALRRLFEGERAWPSGTLGAEVFVSHVAERAAGLGRRDGARQ